MKTIKIYKAGIHLGEEAVIAGNTASGMINFSGCHLSCHFCYTPETSKEWKGNFYSPEQFFELCEDLVKRGARNLNLISPTQFFNILYRPLERLNAQYGELLPIVLKVSGYESAPILEQMTRVGHVFVPDFKVFGEGVAKSVGLPEKYSTIALAAVEKMMKTHGDTEVTESGKISRGILIRHLMMPGQYEDSYQVVSALGDIGYRGQINFMTFFYDPASKRVNNAPSSEVALLTSHAASFGMTTLVNGKSNHAYQLKCKVNVAQSAWGGSHVG